MIWGRTIRRQSGTLPNIIFDITGKDVSDLTEYIPYLLDAGYEPRNVHICWVLANYKIAWPANNNRDRVVGRTPFLETHKRRGAYHAKNSGWQHS